MTPTEAAARHIAIALSCVGLSALRDPLRFGAVCAPNGPAGARAFFCQQNVAQGANSPCETVGAGMVAMTFAELGLPYLQEPLDSAAGEWGRFTALARPRGALHSPENPGKGIRVGCVVHAENAAGRHWRTIVEDLGGGRWRTVDGTLENGCGIIHSVEVEIAGGVYDRTGLRPVREWIDVGELFAALLPCAEPDAADSIVDGDSRAFGAGEIV